MREPSTNFPIEDVESIPEILDALIAAGRIDLVTQHLEKRGITAGDTGPGAESIRIVLDLILKARQGESRLVAELCALALSLYREEGRSVADIARDWGVNRQSMHTRLKLICKKLNVPGIDCGKSEAAKQKYKLTNFRHAKKQQQLKLAA